MSLTILRMLDYCLSRTSIFFRVIYTKRYCTHVNYEAQIGEYHLKPSINVQLMKLNFSIGVYVISMLFQKMISSLIRSYSTDTTDNLRKKT